LNESKVADILNLCLIKNKERLSRSRDTRSWVRLPLAPLTSTRNSLQFLFVFFFLSACVQAQTNCLIKTSLGDITVQLFTQQAPITTQNFLKYVDAKLYDSSSFFRVCTPQNESDRKIKIEVIQGGNVPETKQFPSIKIE